MASLAERALKARVEAAPRHFVQQLEEAVDVVAAERKVGSREGGSPKSELIEQSDFRNCDLRKEEEVEKEAGFSLLISTGMSHACSSYIYKSLRFNSRPRDYLGLVTWSPKSKKLPTPAVIYHLFRTIW